MKATILGTLLGFFLAILAASLGVGSIDTFVPMLVSAAICGGLIGYIVHSASARPSRNRRAVETVAPIEREPISSVAPVERQSISSVAPVERETTSQPHAFENLHRTTLTNPTRQPISSVAPVEREMASDIAPKLSKRPMWVGVWLGAFFGVLGAMNDIATKSRFGPALA